MTLTVRHMISRSLRRVIIRPDVGPTSPVGSTLPASMQRPVDAIELMDQVRDALDRDDDRDVAHGVVFLRTPGLLGVPSPALARLHSEPLPAMEYFRWPFDRVARFAARVVRKLSAPFTRRQEQFNLELLETIRRLEGRLETQRQLCRQLQRRVAELETR